MPHRPGRHFLSLAKTSSGGFQHEIHMHGIKRKNDAAIVSLLQKARVEKCVYIAMYGFYIILR
jgi:hypothetical protein